MTRDKKQQRYQLPLAAIRIVFVLGVLSMIWPGIITLFFSVLLLLQSCCVEQEVAVLSWAEIGQMSMAVAPFRRPGIVSLFPA